MTDEALIEELARVMCKRVVHDDIEALELDWHLWVEDARAILPIIRRREIEAGEKVKAAAVNMVDDLEVGWRDRYDTAVSDAYTALRALDVAAIIGGEHD